MEDLETTANDIDVDEEEEEVSSEDEEDSLSFDDIVSFAMLMETAVTLVGMLIFFIFFVVRPF